MWVCLKGKYFWLCLWRTPQSTQIQCPNSFFSSFFWSSFGGGLWLSLTFHAHNFTSLIFEVKCKSWGDFEFICSSTQFALLSAVCPFVWRATWGKWLIVCVINRRHQNSIPVCIFNVWALNICLFCLLLLWICDWSTSLSILLLFVSEKLLNSSGRELRRALFSLKQIFQVNIQTVLTFFVLFWLWGSCLSSFFKLLALLY